MPKYFFNLSTLSLPLSRISDELSSPLLFQRALLLPLNETPSSFDRCSFTVA